MSRSDSRDRHGAAVPFDLLSTAGAVLDGSGTVVGWSDAAARLLGRPPEEVLGRAAVELLAPDEDPDQDWSGRGPDPAGILRVSHRDGTALTLGVQAGRLTDISGGTRWQLAALDLATAPWWSSSHSVLGRFLAHSPYGIAVLDTDLRYRWHNETLARMSGVGPERIGRRIGEILPDLAPHAVEEQMRRTLETGVPIRSYEYRGHIPSDPDHEHVFSSSFLRLDDEAGRVLGICYMGVDITDRWRTRQRLTLLTDSGARIGTTLDFATTARELLTVAVPQLADFATVDLLEPVLRGEEPAQPTGDGLAPLRRMAHLSVRTDNPEAIAELGTEPGYPASSPMIRCLATGTAELQARIDRDSLAWLADDPRRRDALDRWNLRSLMAVPLRARGVVLGVAIFIRSGNSEPFEPDDLSLAEELVSRAAVCLDNARRYTREHNTALTLQRSLLPHALPVSEAIEVAHRYLPGDSRGGVGGDWFDVIPLSGARVALVVGDVAGHGINAAAAMGRLRTAVHTLADMDLPPDELLAHLDDLVARLMDEQSFGGPAAAAQAQSAKCLYAVFDPVSRRCTMARAGHVPPALRTPDGRVEFAELPLGPPLGVGSLPFEAAEFELAEGTVLALFTDGLLGHATRDPDLAAERLRSALTAARPDLEDACEDLIDAMMPDRIDDDIALLLVRTHGLTPDRIVSWELPADPAVVAEARGWVATALDDWGLSGLAFTTELIVSELVTNAIRYGAEPLALRLIRQSTLICEVSDASSTSPRLRHARTTDEGGRGLFLIAQLARRWGTRYTDTGKIIWAEQDLNAEPF